MQLCNNLENVYGEVLEIIIYTMDLQKVSYVLPRNATLREKTKLAHTSVHFYGFKRSNFFLIVTTVGA